MWFALFISLLPPADAATTVYRCQDARGQAVFSDTPCGADARTQTLREPSVIRGLSREAIEAAQREEPPKARRAAKPTDHCPTPQAIAQAIFRKQVLLCMSMDEVDRAADPALRENFRRIGGADAQGSYEERHYAAASDNWPRYIKFRNGRVAEYREQAPEPSCPPHCARQNYPLYPLPYPPQALPYPPQAQPYPPRAPRYPPAPGTPGQPAYPAYPNIQPEPPAEPAVDIRIQLGDKPEPARPDEDKP